MGSKQVGTMIVNQPHSSPHSSPRQPHPWIGRLIGEGDRYRLDDRLGGGGMGDVFLATDTRLGKLVALKLLKESLAIARDQDLIERFERECNICAALKGAHIVQVSDYGVTASGHPFYAMEYLQGQTLGQLLAVQPRLSIEQTCNIMAQVCAGLHLAHQGVEIWNRETNTSETIKVVHRDLKPDNVFLVPTALGELVKIIDFGIAKIQSLQAEYTSATVGFMGTCHYASPEQVSGWRELDERSDIYSLGVMLYEMLTGTDPFGFDFRNNRITNNAWLTAHASRPPQPFRSHPHCEHLSAQLEAVVMRCLEKSPSARFASVVELSSALQAASAYFPATLPSLQTNPINETYSSVYPSTAPRAAAPPRSTSKRSWLVASSALLTIAVGIYVIPRSLRLPVAVSQSPIASPVQEVRSLALVDTFTENTSPVWSAVLSSDGQTLISAGADRDDTGRFYPIKLWDVKTQRVLQTLNGHTDVVRALSLSQDGKTLASASSDHTIKLWNVATGELIRTFEGHSAPVWSVALSQDGQTLVSGGEDRTVRIWTVQTGESRTLSEHSNTVYSVALNPSGTTIASSSADKTIKLWDQQSGELIRTLGEPGGHRDVVSAVAFSPDGQQLASVGWDGFVKLWNATTGQLLYTFEGHTDRIASVTFMAADTVASAGFDNTIKLWDTKAGKLLQTIPAHDNRVLSVMSHADRSLVSSSSDTTIKLWQ